MESAGPRHRRSGGPKGRRKHDKKREKLQSKARAVESALERMRARERDKKDEGVQGVVKQLQGYEWDAKRQRYFSSSRRAKSPDALVMPKLIPKSLPQCTLVESRRDVLATLLRARGRVSVVGSCGLGFATCAAASADGSRLAVGGLGRLALLDSKRNIEERTVESTVSAVAFTQHGLAYTELGEADRPGRLALPDRQIELRGCAWSFAIGGDLAVVGGCRQLSIYRLEKPEPRRVKVSSDCLAVALSDDGRRACIGGRDGVVDLWDLRGGRLGLHRFTSAVDDIVQVDDYAYLAADRRSALHFIDSRLPNRPLIAFDQRRAAPAVSSRIALLDGCCFAAGPDHIVRCWRLADAQLIAAPALPCGVLPPGAALLAADRPRTGTVAATSLFQDATVLFVARDPGGSLITFDAKPSARPEMAASYAPRSCIRRQDGTAPQLFGIRDKYGPYRTR